MMKRYLFLIFVFLTINLSFGQNPNDLNQQAKTLIQEGKLTEALPILKKSAEMGNAEAQYNYGYFLQNGAEEAKDEKEAVKWFEKSSKNGFNDGHYAMMMAYGKGQGVEQNSEKAFSYALKCASNDDATCMWNVVNCYATGNGVNKDIYKFKEWLIRLAKLPNPENLAMSGYITSARLELAHFYRNGEYFYKDNYQSYLWYLIYNESKVDFSILKQEEVIKEINDLEKNLSIEQVKKAPEEAEKLLDRKLQNLNELYNNSL